MLQQRSPKKDTFPGRWDVSCAGHLSGTDESVETAVRELEEELGLLTDAAAMEAAFVGTVPSEVAGETATHGRFLCREFQDVYVLRLGDLLPEEASLDALTLGDGEVCPAYLDTYI